MPNVRISDLPDVVTPLTGAELLETTQGGLSKKVTVSDLITALGQDASFVVLSLSSTLPNERVLTAGAGIDIVDAGAGGSVTVQLGAGIITLESLILSDSDPVDLVDTGNALNIGSANPGVAAHLALDATSIQAKNGASTAANTSIGRLGGVTNLGSQVGTGSVQLYNNAEIKLLTLSTGVVIRGNTDGDPTTPDSISALLSLQSRDGNLYASLGFTGASDLALINRAHEGLTYLQGEDSSGVLVTYLTADPEGTVSLHLPQGSGNTVRMELNALGNGIIVRGSLSNSPSTGGAQDVTVFLANNAGALAGGLLYEFNTTLTLASYVQDGPILLIGTPTAGGGSPVFYGDPNAGGRMYYDGAKIFQTEDGQVRVADDGTGNTVRLELVDDLDAPTLRASLGYNASDVLELRGAIHGANVRVSAEDAGGVLRTLFGGDPDGQADLYQAGTSVLRTHGTGVDIADASGNPLLGFYGTSFGTRRGYIQFSGTQASIRSEVHGGPVALQGEDVGGVLRTLFEGDPDGESALYYAGISRFSASVAGQTTLRSDGNTDTENLKLLFTHQDGTIRGELGYGLSTDFNIIQRVHGALMRFYGEDAGGVVRENLRLDVNGGSLMLNAGVTSLQTTTAANGGLNVNNTLTGGGLERALTESDIAQTGSFTGTLTGMSGSVTGTVSWLRIGNLVTLYTETAIFGTSNATTMTMTGIPAALQTTNDKHQMCPLINSSGRFAGAALLQGASGTITFYLVYDANVDAPATLASGQFLNSGNKGVHAGWTFAYVLD